MQAVKITTDQPELNERFNRTLSDTVEALEDAKIPYCFIGGVASGGLGRPRSTHDIDVFVRPEDSELALRALEKFDFRTEKTDPSWLYKAWKENILVDVIFKSKGEIYLDNEMYRRSIKAEFHGKQLRLVAPEDLLIIKALAHSEATPGHWHDALALLSHATIDWEYLIHRARRAPRRLLSLFSYAHSNDIYVPKSVIDDLYRIVFSDLPPHRQAPGYPSGFESKDSENAKTNAPHPQPVPAIPQSKPERHPEIRGKGRDWNAAAHLKEAIATDLRTNELDIEVEVEASDRRILLRGEVTSVLRKRAVMEVTRELFPDCEIENQLRVVEFHEPTEAEEVS